MIKPTVGRVVLYFPPANDLDAMPAEGQPCAAIVAHVHSDRCVNLAVFNANGVAHSRTSVTLLQDDDKPPAHGCYAEWMPFQKGQAANADTKALGETPAEAPRFLPDFISSAVTYFVVADRAGKLWRVNAITGKANAVEFDRAATPAQ